MPRFMAKTIVPILVLWIITGSYVSSQLYRGWIPHDEGTLAHSAERVESSPFFESYRELRRPDSLNQATAA